MEGEIHEKDFAHPDIRLCFPFAEQKKYSSEKYGVPLEEFVEDYLRDYVFSEGSKSAKRGLYSRSIREFERPLIAVTLEMTNGNQIKASKILGLNRNTLRKKINELDIEIIKKVKN